MQALVVKKDHGACCVTVFKAKRCSKEGVQTCKL